VVTTTGHLQCLSPTNACELAEAWPGLSKLDTVDGHCARSTDGAVRCWQVDRKSRTVGLISGAAGSTQLSSGSSHACAVLAEHRVVCWGENMHGELGRGVTDTLNHTEAAPVAL
jgi:alpha-tubulin suppressor-like RCC1 family protein